MRLTRYQNVLHFRVKCSKSRRLLGLRPRPRWGSLRRSPRPPSRERLLAFGNRSFAPSALALTKIVPISVPPNVLYRFTPLLNVLTLPFQPFFPIHPDVSLYFTFCFRICSPAFFSSILPRLQISSRLYQLQGSRCHPWLVLFLLSLPQQPLCRVFRFFFD